MVDERRKEGGGERKVRVEEEGRPGWEAVLLGGVGGLEEGPPRVEEEEMRFRE